jgi:hypothetical protein
MMIEDSQYYEKMAAFTIPKKCEVKGMRHPEAVKLLLKETEKGNTLSEFSKTKLANKNNTSLADRSKIIIYGNFGEVLNQN